MALSLQQEFAAKGKSKRLRPEDFDCVVLAYTPPEAWSTRALANSFGRKLNMKPLPEGSVVDLREDVVEDLREDVVDLREEEPAAPAVPAVPAIPEVPAVRAIIRPLKKQKQRVVAEPEDINAWEGMVRNAFWAIQPPHPRLLEFFYFGKWALKPAMKRPARSGWDKNLQLLMEWGPEVYSGMPRPTTFLRDVQLHHMHDCDKHSYNMMGLQELQARKRRDERWDQIWSS